MLDGDCASEAAPDFLVFTIKLGSHLGINRDNLGSKPIQTTSEKLVKVHVDELEPHARPTTHD